MSITLAELRTQARQRSDQEESQLVTDAELTTYINSSIAELHDILIQAYSSDYYISEYTFTTVPNQADYNLPASFYKLRGVDAQINGDDPISLKPFNFNERNRFTEGGIWDLFGLPLVRYRLLGNKIRFSPVPDNATVIKLWYIPVATKLVNDSDTLDDYNQYSEFVVVDTAIKMLTKEESDVAVLAAQRQALMQRITDAAQNRDAGSPEAVSDVYAEDGYRLIWGRD